MTHYEEQPVPQPQFFPAVEKVKTYKREVAVVLFILLCGLGYGAMVNEQAMIIFDKLRWPIFSFGAGAFGLDAVAKQWSNR